MRAMTPTGKIIALGAFMTLAVVALCMWGPEHALAPGLMALGSIYRNAVGKPDAAVTSP